MHFVFDIFIKHNDCQVAYIMNQWFNQWGNLDG